MVDALPNHWLQNVIYYKQCFIPDTPTHFLRLLTNDDLFHRTRMPYQYSKTVGISKKNILLVRCGAVRCGAVRCGAVRCGAVRCGAVRCGAVRCGAVRCGAVRCGAVQSIAQLMNKDHSMLLIVIADIVYVAIVGWSWCSS